MLIKSLYCASARSSKKGRTKSSSGLADITRSYIRNSCSKKNWPENEHTPRRRKTWAYIRLAADVAAAEVSKAVQVASFCGDCADSGGHTFAAGRTGAVCDGDRPLH